MTPQPVPENPVAVYAPADKMIPAPLHAISRGRLLLAMAVAIASDALSAFTGLFPPAQLLVDVCTALLLFCILGWRWELLPVLIAEAIPGLAVMPFWVAVVAVIGVRSARR